MRSIMSCLLCVVMIGCDSSPTEVAASATELPLAEDTPREGVSALRVGTIRMNGTDTTLLEIPAVVRRGEVTALYLTTYAGGCIGRDTTIARVGGLRVNIVPYQRVFVPLRGGACSDILILERRAIRVTFATSGEAIVRVVGRVSPDRGLVAIQRNFAVQ